MVFGINSTSKAGSNCMSAQISFFVARLRCAFYKHMA